MDNPWSYVVLVTGSTGLGPINWPLVHLFLLHIQQSVPQWVPVSPPPLQLSQTIPMFLEQCHCKKIEHFNGTGSLVDLSGLIKGLPDVDEEDELILHCLGEILWNRNHYGPFPT